MTREEAVQTIKGERWICCIEKYREALDMAIKALEQGPCEDAISREAVLEQTYLWSKNEFLRVTNPFDYLRERIKSLPYVTPQPQSCEDAISRRAALDAMYALCDTGETLKENPWRDNPHIDAIIDAIENLPTVIPQEPKEP